MKDKILNNLYLAVDYVDVISDEGKKTGNVQFYLVGTLPVLIDYKDSENQVAKLKVAETINSDDPELRSLMGKKATDVRRRRYSSTIRKMVKRIEAALTEAQLTKTWNGKAINDVSIVKMEHGESRTTPKI